MAAASSRAKRAKVCAAGWFLTCSRSPTIEAQAQPRAVSPMMKRRCQTTRRRRGVGIGEEGVGPARQQHDGRRKAAAIQTAAGRPGEPRAARRPAGRRSRPPASVTMAAAAVPFSEDAQQFDVERALPAPRGGELLARLTHAGGDDGDAGPQQRDRLRDAARSFPRLLRSSTKDARHYATAVYRSSQGKLNERLHPVLRKIRRFHVANRDDCLA